MKEKHIFSFLSFFFFQMENCQKGLLWLNPVMFNHNKQFEQQWPNSASFLVSVLSKFCSHIKHESSFHTQVTGYKSNNKNPNKSSYDNLITEANAQFKHF